MVMNRFHVRKYRRKVTNCSASLSKRLSEGWYCFLLPAAIIAIVIFLIIPEECILKDYIPGHLIILDVVTSTKFSGSYRLSLCSITPTQKHFIRPSFEDVKVIPQLAFKYKIKLGGEWQPKNCRPRFKTAIIVPFRKRQEQLDYFLLYMHNFLPKQLIAYKIFVVRQLGDKPFNRGKLFNVGFREVNQREHFDCYIFHDVDLFPEVLTNIYGCSSQPRHLITALDIFQYKLPYCGLIGGAVALTPFQFVKVNGFANRFYGWGGEDDDFYNRVIANGFRVTRWDPKVARYFMITHKKETPNNLRHSLLKNSTVLLKDDGLSNLEYTFINYGLNSTFTLIDVEL